MMPGDASMQRRGPATSQNRNIPSNVKPSVRYGLRERQQAMLQKKQDQRAAQWAEWEEKMELEENARRRQAAEELERRRRIDRESGAQQQASWQYQAAYQTSEHLRQTQERNLEDMQEQIRQRALRRQRQKDRWINVDTQPQVQQQQEPTYRENKEPGALYTDYLQSRMRQKVFRFAEIVDTVGKEKPSPSSPQPRPSPDVQSSPRSPAPSPQPAQRKEEEYIDW